MEKTTSTLSRIPVPAAQLSIIGSVGYLVILALLHIIKPEVTPTWQTLSIYARGNHGWIQQVNFALFGLSYAALFVTLKSQARSVAGRIGLVFLAIAAVASVIAGIFVSDPLNTLPSAVTTSGTWHSIGAGLAIWGAPLASLFLTLSLWRKNPDWAPVRRQLKWVIAIPLLGLVLFMASADPAGHYGPGSYVGLMNRVVVVAIVIWQVTVSRAAIKLRRSI